MVMSGIENENYEQAVSIIKEQLEVMKKGDFTEQDIEANESRYTKSIFRND